PAIVVKNMEGGSGVKAASYITTVTPQDGTSLGLFLDTLTLGKVLGGPGEFDPVKLTWIGRIVSTATLAMVWHTAPAQSIAKAKPLYAHGAHAMKELPDVPGLADVAVDDRSRRILSLLGGGPDIGRSLTAEPGIPKERAAALRKAFDETMADPGFVADMHKRN